MDPVGAIISAMECFSFAATGAMLILVFWTAFASPLLIVGLGLGYFTDKDPPKREVLWISVLILVLLTAGLVTGLWSFRDNVCDSAGMEFPALSTLIVIPPFAFISWFFLKQGWKWGFRWKARQRSTSPD